MTPPVRVLVVDDSALMRKLIPQILANRQLDSGRRHRHGRKLRSEKDRRNEAPGCDSRSRHAGHGRPGHAERDHAAPSVASHRGEFPQHARSIGNAAGAVHGSVRFCRQAQRCFRQHAGDRARSSSPRSRLPPRAGGSQSARSPHLRGRRRRPLPKLRPEPRESSRSEFPPADPQALQYVLPQLPKNFPGTILIVQHMPEGFTEMFSRRLEEICAITVKEVQSGDLLLAGRALICPGNRHLKVKRLRARRRRRAQR